MAADPILLAADSLPIGGTERQIVELLRGLRRSGRFPIALAILDNGGALERAAREQTSVILPVHRRARFDCTPALSLAWHARRMRVRLIHAFGWMSGVAGLIAARCLRVPIVHGAIRSTPPRLGWRDHVARWCAVHSDWIVANSRAGLKAYGLSSHPRTQVIPNGIDFARFEGVGPQYEDDPTICMVANFSALKDHASVIRALPCIRRAFPRAHLVLVGHDRGTLADNRRLAHRLGLDGAVRFITDTLCPEPLVARSDVCVLASPSESFCNAILEYMALAKPVVATDTCGDTAALVRESACGFLVPRNSPEPLAARVIELLRDPERARRMGEAGRRGVQAFTLPRMVAEHERLYAQLLARETPSGGA